MGTLKSKSTAIITAGLCTCLLVLASCRKERQELDSDTASAAEYAVADAAFADVANIADEAYSGNLDTYRTSEGGVQGTLSACADLTIDTLAKSMVIDFGTVNCECADGVFRRGKILVSWTGAYRDSGSSHTITFNDYFVNSNQILGTKTDVNNGINTNGNLSFSVSVNGSIVWDPQSAGGAGTSTIVSISTREWICGASQPVCRDDVYLISGTAAGETRTGNAYTMSTSQPLKKEIGWRHFTDGILQFTPSGKFTRTIDYGYVNGGRDALAQVAINGYTFNIQLK